MSFKLNFALCIILVILSAAASFVAATATCPNGQTAKSVSLQTRGVTVDSRNPNANTYGSGTVTLGEVDGSQLGLWQWSVPAGVDMNSVSIQTANVKFAVGSSPAITDACQGAAKVSANLASINPATVTFNSKPALYPTPINGDCPNTNGYSTLALVNVPGQSASHPVPLDVKAAIQLSLQNNRNYLGLTLQSVYKYIFLSSDVATLTVEYCEKQSTGSTQSGSSGCSNLHCNAGTTCYETSPNYPGGPQWAVCCAAGFVGCGRPGGINGICINNATESCCYPSGTAQVVPKACKKGEICRSVDSATAVCEAPTTCFGVAQNDANVCSGAGTCVAKDTCSCSCGRGGQRCEQSLCFGKLSLSDSTVCSGHGRCVAPDTCQCNSGFSGRRCENSA